MGRRQPNLGMSLGLAFLLAFTQSPKGTRCEAQERKGEPRSISVTGIGRISAVPDVAEIQVGVLTQSSTAMNALQANNEAMKRLSGILKARGIADKDVQTTQVHVMPQYTQPQPRQGASHETGEFVPRIFGYRVENSVQITAHQIDKLGALLDALVEGGVNQIRGIGFRVEDQENLLDKARKLAMVDARRKASLLAEESGVHVGFPLKIEEHSYSSPISPRAYPTAPVIAEPSGAMPVSAGEQELTIHVSVVFELNIPVAGPATLR